MAVLHISTVACNAAADAIVDLIDVGSSAGVVRVYDGTMPASPGVAVSTQTLLATLTFSDPAFGPAASRVVTAGALTGDTAADATGTASWFRVADSDDTAIADGDVTDTSGDGVMKLDTTSIVAGVPVNIDSFTFTMPDGT